MSATRLCFAPFAGGDRILSGAGVISFCWRSFMTSAGSCVGKPVRTALRLVQRASKPDYRNAFKNFSPKLLIWSIWLQRRSSRPRWRKNFNCTARTRRRVRTVKRNAPLSQRCPISLTQSIPAAVMLCSTHPTASFVDFPKSPQTSSQNYQSTTQTPARPPSNPAIPCFPSPFLPQRLLQFRGKSSFPTSP
jgi:hypothetical protein